MKKIFLSTLIITLVMTLVACSSGAVKLDEKNNGQSLDLKSGEKLSITLEGNPTTGYSWEISSIDQAIVEQAGEPDYKSDSKLIGSGGVFTFHFKAVKAGTSIIKLIYHRSWEEGVEPIQAFEVTINVK